METNWKNIRRTKFKTDEQEFKPFNLMEIRVFQPLHQDLASVVDEEHIYKMIHMDHALLHNFAFPVSNPNTALLMKVKNV